MEQNFSDKPRERKPRADALRNRARLVEVAKAVLGAKGAEASLEEIAREADVGIGTLYRHFPTRDALIEAVYRKESEALVAQLETLAAEAAPVEALRQGLLLFIDHVVTKQGMTGALNSHSGGAPAVYAAAGQGLADQARQLVARAVASGEIRSDVEPFDLMRAIAGCVDVRQGEKSVEGARRMVDVLIAGLQSGQPGA